MSCGSCATLKPFTPLRIVRPNPIVLARVLTSVAAPTSGTVEWSAPLVDPRVRTKVTCFFAPDTAVATGKIRFGTVNTLWAAVRERDDVGGMMLPVLDVTGTSESPDTSPVNATDGETGNFAALAWEGGSIGDELFGRLYIQLSAAEHYTSNSVAVGGRWMLQSAYAPLIPMWPEEWADLQTRMIPPRIVGGATQLAIGRSA